IHRDAQSGIAYGIVGATTPALRSISSPGAVQATEDLQSTALAVQKEIDRLQGAGIDRIIFISHLQSVLNDIELIRQVKGIDIAVAGGGDEIMLNPAIPQER